MFVVLIVAATFMMVARVPHGGGASAAASPAEEAGCLSCHRIGSEGSERPGGDLTAVGAQLTPSQIRRALLRPPPGMPSYGDLPTGELNALVSYLAGLQ